MYQRSAWVRKYRRHFLSFAASLGCALATHLWYISTEITMTEGGSGSAIATIAEIKKEVQRRPARRLTWQGLRDRENLFEGEQIRTQADSRAKLDLPGGGFIYVEPSSLVTLERRGDDLILDFLKGNVFVSGAAGANLKVRADNKEIRVDGAEILLEKAPGQATRANVTSGTVEGVASVKDIFSPLTPAPYATVYVTSGEATTWSWSNLVPEESSVELQVGSSREDLRTVPTQRREGNRLEATLAAGEYYWRLYRTDADQKAVSRTYFVRVVEKRPIVPVFPEKNAELTFAASDPTVLFRWENPAGLEDVRLEVAASPDFSGGAESHAAGEGLLQVPFAREGNYFVRYRGKLPGQNEILVSEVTKFSLRKAAATPEQPILLTPVASAALSVDPGEDVELTWRETSVTRNYRVRLKQVATGQETEFVVSRPKLSVPNLLPGAYQWQVMAVGRNSTRDKPVEVVSELRSFDFKIAELAVPAYAEGTEHVLRGSGRGEVEFAWKPVPKAEAYEVELRDAAGKVLETKEIDGTKFSAKRLKPGKYSVQLKSKDGKGRRSLASEAKPLVVPDKSSLKPPKLLEVQVDE